MTVLSALPPRVAHPEQARARYPQELALLVPALERSDVEADEAVASLAGLSSREAHAIIGRATQRDPNVPAPLARLVESCRALPAWVDWEQIGRAGPVFFRAGVLGGITLGMRSLVYGYASPVGNKPLALSGALEQKAQRRLAETSRFVAAVCEKDGLLPGHTGFSYCIHVRLMHAQVRKMARADARWDHTRWGLPINQHDMLATVLLFSVVFLDGLARLGLETTQEEQDDYQALWRLVGFYLGVEDELLPKTAEEARRRAEFIRFTQGDPDEDSRALVAALMNEPLRRAQNERERRIAAAHVAFAQTVCRALLDPDTARGLGLCDEGNDSASRLVPRLRATMRLLERVRQRITPLSELVERLGAHYWDFNANRSDKAQAFSLPEALDGQSRA